MEGSNAESVKYLAQGDKQPLEMSTCFTHNVLLQVTFIVW